MADRTVSVRLKADISEYTASLAKAAAATRGLGSGIDREIDRSVSPQLRKSGERSGGVLAQGIQTGLIRNSPLIAAAVGGALAAGAPVAIAGAAMLFGGIAGVAGAQSLQVRKAWTELGDEIAKGTIEDARVVIPELEQMARDLGAGFQELRPQLRDAFEATAPLVETFSAGIVGLARNAMPGFVSAVQSAEPVMAGFRSFLESVGSGVGDFFGGLSQHAPAAGRAFASLGDIVEELLPIIGEFLGAGAELAAIVLPPLADALGTVADVARGLGPALPPLVLSITALRIAGSVAGGVKALAGSMDALTVASRVQTGLAGVRAAMTPLNVAGGALTLTLGLLAGAYSESETQTREWSDALNEGGTAARAARIEMAEHDSQVRQATSGFVGWLTSLSAGGQALRMYADDTQKAKDQHREYLASLSPLEALQRKVRIAQDEMTRAIMKFGADSPIAIRATKDYETAQKQLERSEQQLQRAIDGVTSAMVEQADQALAAIDSQFGYRNSTNALEDAQATLAKTIKDRTNKDKELRTSEEDVRRAQLAVEEATYRTAVAFGQAQADLSGLDKQSVQYKRLVQTEMLRELYRLRDAAGPQMRAAIQEQITALQRNGVQLDDTARRTDNARREQDELRVAIIRLPNGKLIKIDAPTQVARDAVNFLQRTIDSLRGRTVEIQVRASGRFIVNPNGGLQEFAEGGYTGDGGKYEPKGVVHGGEYVFTKERTAKLGVGTLERLEAILPGYAAGGPVPVNVNFDSRRLEATMEQVANAMRSATPKTPTPGSGSVAGGWQGLWSIIRRAFPEARLNSSYRPGDPGWHGAGRAIDLGWSRAPGGSGNAYMASMNRWIHDNYGGRSLELIYDGYGDDRPDLLNGRAHTYSFATQLQHMNHVHWAMANGGIIGEPVIGRGLRTGASYSFAERGPETVVPGIRSREFSASSGAGAASLAIDYARLAAAVAQVAGPTNVYTWDGGRSVVKALAAHEQQRAALASPW